MQNAENTNTLNMQQIVSKIDTSGINVKKNTPIYYQTTQKETSI